MSDKKQSMIMGKKQIMIWMTSLLPVALAAAVYGKLPDRIPMN